MPYSIGVAANQTNHPLRGTNILSSMTSRDIWLPGLDWAGRGDLGFVAVIGAYRKHAHFNVTGAVESNSR